MAQNAEYRGTDNVLADLGFPDAEELTTKTILAKQLNEVSDSRHLTRSDAAELLEMPQPKVSAIRNYKLRGVTLEHLMRALSALGNTSRSSSALDQRAGGADRCRRVGAITPARSTTGASGRRLQVLGVRSSAISHLLGRSGASRRASPPFARCSRTPISRTTAQPRRSSLPISVSNRSAARDASGSAGL